MIKFSDGISFETDKPLSIQRLKDGYYVVGNNMLIPVATYDEGLEIIASFNASKAASK